MSDSGHVFHSAELRDEVFSLREKYKDLLSHLRRIPHLEIPLDVPIDSIRTECARITQWAGYRVEERYAKMNGYTEAQLDKYARDNQGRTLIEYKKDSYFVEETSSVSRSTEETFYRQDGRLEYFPTDLANEMPHTLKTLYSFCDYLKQTRIMKIGPGYHLPWHSHHLPEDKDFPYFLGVLQIPVQTNNDCLYKVRRGEHVISTSYQAGKAYMFNSFFEHSVENRSDADRISIFCQFHLEYEPVLQFLEPIVSKYTGPLIQLGSVEDLSSSRCKIKPYRTR